MTENSTENSTEDYWAQFVPKNFEMDPKTDELLMGDRLRDGMIVLIEDDDFRMNVSNLQKYGTAEALAKAKKYNRWATVSNFQIMDSGDISFFAGYKDGIKKHMRHSPSFSWYVKLDSIPEEDPLDAEAEELKEALAYLAETSKVAWSDILEMMKDEADLLDKAAARLREKDYRFNFSEPEEELLELGRRTKSAQDRQSLAEKERRAKIRDLGEDDSWTDPGSKNPESPNYVEYPAAYRPATIEDVFRNFVGSNMDFFTSKEVHSLNEIRPKYTRYCDKVVGRQWKLDREHFLQQLKVYFRSYASVEDKDEEGVFETDIQLIGFFNPHLNTEDVQSMIKDNEEN